MAAPLVGTVGQIFLNGFGYMLLANSQSNWAPRLRKATPRADGAENYVDFGPGKRMFKFTVLATNGLENGDGTPFSLTASQIKGTLESSYALVNTTMTYVDVDGLSYTVRFDHLAHHLIDPTSQNFQGGPEYHCDVELVVA